MILDATMSRVAEWFSALRHDQDGVERAKVRHARLLWRAYVSRR
jgi:hypothetical protein